VEFQQLLPRLTDPAKFGGDPRDAFTVIAPSLPGYGFSFRPDQPRLGLRAIADTFASLMTDVLGYRRFAAQGGDWGAFVTTLLGAFHPEKLAGIHVTLLAAGRDTTPGANPSEDETRYLEQLKRWEREETGYQWIQGTKPQNAGVRADGLTGRIARVDHGEVPHVDRLRRRCGAPHRSRSSLDERDGVLGDRRDQLVVLALLRSPPRTLADPERPAHRGANRVCRVPERNPARPSQLGRALLRSPPLDDDEVRRPLRRDGRARSARRGHHEFFRPLR
jgi:pimeloyl-ACP methyl ester carboxylesterase